MYKALSYFDQRTLRGWFKDQALVKLLVLFGFLGTILLVTWGIYAAAVNYFSYLSDYEVYGAAITSYTLQAAVLIVGTMALFSYLASLYGFTVNSSNLSHWLTLPIEPVRLTRVLSIRVFLFGLWPFIVLLMPLLLACTKAFAQTKTDYLTYLVIPTLALGAYAAAIWLLVGLSKLIETFGKKGWWIVGLILMALVILLLKLVFPPALFDVSESVSESQFITSFRALPLMSWWLPTNWLGGAILNGISVKTGLMMGITFILAGASELYWEKTQLRLWQRRQERSLEAGKRTVNLKQRFYWPGFKNITGNLAWVNFLRLRRNGGEVAYFIFILILTGLFAGIMAIFPRKMPPTAEWSPLLYGAVIIGFGFLTTVMAIRFIYPLMSVEGRFVWQVFSAPVNRWRLFDAKLLIGLIMLVPWIMLALVIGKQLPLVDSEIWLFRMLLISGALGILVITLTLGFISPNFNEPDNASTTSTSASGLAALIMSIIWTVGIMKIWMLRTTVYAQEWAGLILPVGLIGISLVWLALSKLYKYEKIN